LIFVTVGTQLPFDRLVSAVDSWAVSSKRSDVIAQVGASVSPPQGIEWVRLLTPSEFRSHIMEADLIVSHAGIGTILTALDFNKPVLVMPRFAQLGEQRSDHQVATAERLSDLGLVDSAMTEADLIEQMSHLTHAPRARSSITPDVKQELIDRIRSFVDSEVLAGVKHTSWHRRWLW
jgi:UDP-N-acetylglucosamine transferase subunit ALG13